MLIFNLDLKLLCVENTVRTPCMICSEGILAPLSNWAIIECPLYLFMRFVSIQVIFNMKKNNLNRNRKECNNCHKWRFILNRHLILHESKFKPSALIWCSGSQAVTLDLNLSESLWLVVHLKKTKQCLHAHRCLKTKIQSDIGMEGEQLWGRPPPPQE